MSYISVFYFFIMFSLHIVRHQTTFALQTVSLTKDLILYFCWVQKFGKSTSLSDGKKIQLLKKQPFGDKTQDMIQNKKPRYATHLPAIPGNIKERELRFPGMQVIPCCLLRLSRHRSRCHAQLSSRSPWANRSDRWQRSRSGDCWFSTRNSDGNWCFRSCRPGACTY